MRESDRAPVVPWIELQDLHTVAVGRTDLEGPLVGRDQQSFGCEGTLGRALGGCLGSEERDELRELPVGCGHLVGPEGSIRPIACIERSVREAEHVTAVFTLEDRDGARPVEDRLATAPATGPPIIRKCPFDLCCPFVGVVRVVGRGAWAVIESMFPVDARRLWSRRTPRTGW